jgi:hypothetical protein
VSNQIRGQTTPAKAALFGGGVSQGSGVELQTRLGAMLIKQKNIIANKCIYGGKCEGLEYTLRSKVGI